MIGPNGAGKSSPGPRARRPGAGRPARSGSTASTCSALPAARARRRHGLPGPDAVPPPDARVDNVAFGPRSRGAARADADARAQDWLDRLGIGDLPTASRGQLSGGQAQRVAIARALATDPALLLLDEPLAGLDVKVADGAADRARPAPRVYDGVTLLVTHDAIDALTIADRVLVLDDGGVAQVGTPAEVAQRPRTEHVARLVGLNVAPARATS